MVFKSEGGKGNETLQQQQQQQEQYNTNVVVSMLLSVSYLLSD